MKHHPTAPNDLAALARLHGVQTGYVNMIGRWRSASPKSLLAVLRALGVTVHHGRDVSEALREARRARAHRVVEPVEVVWCGQPSTIPVQLPDRALAGWLCSEWQLENGEVRRHEFRLDRLPEAGRRRIEGERFVRRLVPVPRHLPMGYHLLRLEHATTRRVSQVFCAPEACFQVDRQRRGWGVFVPLYALHSARSWGAGDLADLKELITWLRRQGGRLAGTLPLLPAFLDEPCEPSPYSPVSRLFWNEFYLDLEGVPELATCPPARRRLDSGAFQEGLRRLRDAPLVDFVAQMALKRQVLGLLSRSFFAQSSTRLRAFERFLTGHPQLADYARFRAMQEQHGRAWSRWPARQRDGDLRDGDCRESLQQYHLYVQWLAHEQMTQLAEHARRQQVTLYLDVPLGTHRDGYDAWRHRNLFALEASGGAPPDPVFTQAQDWGFAPLHPERNREQGYAYVRAYLRHHLQQAGLLRLDHVMGLHRLYWVPQGLPASQGVYVTYPADEFYAILSIESHRHRASIVGENLGTVPPGLNRRLRRHGVSGMFVVQCELRSPPRPALRRIPADVVASLNTHDMPPFAAFWDGLDIADRQELRPRRDREVLSAYRSRERLRRSLQRLLGRRAGSQPDTMEISAVFRDAVEHLGASAARWVLLNLEDLWGETASQNTPGTSCERVNWQRKAQFDLEAIRRNPQWLAVLTALRGLRPVRRDTRSTRLGGGAQRKRRRREVARMEAAGALIRGTPQ